VSDTFDIAAVRSRLSKQAVAVLETAEDLGWVLEWASSKRQAISLRSGFDQHKLLLPLNSINANRLRSLKTQVARHSDPERLKDAADIGRLAERNRREGKIPLTFDIASDNDITTQRGGMPLSAGVERALNRARLALDEEEAAKAEPPTATPEPDHEDTSAYVVSESPWMVRKGGRDGGTGRMYESHSVVHRVWSDGFEDYKCRFCEYVNVNPRGVAGHAARTKDGHPAADAAPELHTVNEYEATEIKHPFAGVRRLTSELTSALDSLPEGWCDGDFDAADIARTLAEHVYRMRPDREPTEPLTAEQIVRRIALMVDTGRLAEMHQQVERTAAAMVEMTEARNRLTDEVIAMQQEVAAARADAERLREERKVLAQMLSADE
jgi:hypothetical protein